MPEKRAVFEARYEVQPGLDEGGSLWIDLTDLTPESEGLSFPDGAAFLALARLVSPDTLLFTGSPSIAGSSTRPSDFSGQRGVFVRQAE